MVARSGFWCDGKGFRFTVKVSPKVGNRDIGATYSHRAEHFSVVETIIRYPSGAKFTSTLRFPVCHRTQCSLIGTQYRSRFARMAKPHDVLRLGEPPDKYFSGVPARFVHLLVCSLLCRSGQPQVGKLVVGTVAVEVVDGFSVWDRPDKCNPNESVHGNLSPSAIAVAQRNLNVPMDVWNVFRCTGDAIFFAMLDAAISVYKDAPIESRNGHKSFTGVDHAFGTAVWTAKM